MVYQNRHPPHAVGFSGKGETQKEPLRSPLSTDTEAMVLKPKKVRSQN